MYSSGRSIVLVGLRTRYVCVRLVTLGWRNGGRSYFTIFVLLIIISRVVRRGIMSYFERKLFSASMSTLSLLTIRAFRLYRLDFLDIWVCILSMIVKGVFSFVCEASWEVGYMRSRSLLVYDDVIMFVVVL